MVSRSALVGAEQWRMVLQAARKGNTSSSCARPQRTLEIEVIQRQRLCPHTHPRDAYQGMLLVGWSHWPMICLIISRSNCLYFCEFHCKTSHHQSSIPCQALLNAPCSHWPSVPHELTSKKTASTFQQVTLSPGKQWPTFAASQDRPTRELPPC